VAGGGRPTLRLAELRDLLADRLRGQPTRAAFRTGDLTMCTLVPMRSVPHRVVCLVGLDDGSFPRGGAPDGDDLLSRPDVRRPGDHDRRAEDRQLLLDAVLAATDALVVTYAGRDPSTNEERPPAVPVNELLDVLDRTAVGPPAPDGSPRPVRAHIVHDHPLQPADRRYFEPSSLGFGRPWGFDPALLAGAAALATPAPAAAVVDFLPEPLAPLVEPVIALDDLVRFVEHPAQAFLRQRLGLSLREWDDRPDDRITIELDNLGAWGVGNRILLALLTGGDAEAVCAAERARGLLPPGGMGASSLAKARDKAVAIAEAARQVADGRRTSLDVDLVLPDGRQLVGAVPEVLGDVIRPTTFSKLAPKRLAAAWVRFLAASATHPERPLTTTLVGSGGAKPATVTFPALGASTDERRRRAVELLGIVVDLRDRGLREPLPLATATSHRYATQVRDGNPDALESAASSWTSTFGWEREDRDAEHVRVFGGVRTFAELAADPPEPDEAGAGWAMTETTRFGRLARRLWDPILDAAASGTVPLPEAWRS
jgi:exodeoxyribonuclease V gamma subunit